jgi:hypothetical protein
MDSTTCRLNSLWTQTYYRQLQQCMKVCMHGSNDVYVFFSHELHSIAHVLGTQLQTKDFVYSQILGGNSPLAELNTLKSKQGCILILLTSDACVLCTARRVDCCIGWLHSCDNQRTTQHTLRWIKSEKKMCYIMPKLRLASLTLFTVSTKSCLKDSQWWDAPWLWKTKNQPYCVD